MTSPKVQEDMSRGDAGQSPPSSSDEQGVQPLTMEFVRQANDILYDFVSTAGKGLCFGVCPYWLPICKTPDEVFEKQYKKCPEKLQVTGIVVRQGKVVGIIKMHQYEHYQSFEDSLMHTTKPGEMYIESLAVRKECRGQGLGTALLEWGEQAARARGCSVLTLGVVIGNPARRLYERFGFENKKESFPHACCNDACAWCLIGCPYWQIGVIVMEKKLQL